MNPDTGEFVKELDAEEYAKFTGQGIEDAYEDLIGTRNPIHVEATEAQMEALKKKLGDAENLREARRIETRSEQRRIK